MNVAAFLQTLPIMGMGMGGIFVVILVIYGCIAVLNRVTTKKADKDEE